MIIIPSNEFGISFSWELCPVLSENRCGTVDKCDGADKHP